MRESESKSQAEVPSGHEHRVWIKCRMVQDMRGAKTARPGARGSPGTPGRQQKRRGVPAFPHMRPASGPDPFKARRSRPPGGVRPATAAAGPSTAVAGRDLTALRPATSKVPTQPSRTGRL